MSIGRLLKRKIAGEENLVDLIDQEVLKRKVYSFDDVVAATKEFSKHSDEDGFDRDKFMKAFYQLFQTMFSDPPRSTKSIHPSSFKEDCSRQLYYEFTDAERTDSVTRKINGQTQRIFDIGTWVHVYIQVILWQAGVLEKSEVPVRSRKKRINGRGDGIIFFKGKRLLLEIKTINSFQVSKVKSKPLDHHEYQASIYASELGMEEICYLYVNKDTFEIITHILPVHASYVKLANEKIDDLNYSIEKKIAPTRICKDVNSHYAKTCPFKTLCFKKRGT